MKKIAKIIGKDEDIAEYDEKIADAERQLKDAQEKGFAEADPTADVEGIDACRKIAILTRNSAD